MALAAAFSAPPALASPSPKPHGLWLLPRKDAANTARADLPGRMKTAPKEVWRYGAPPQEHAFTAAVTVHGKEAYLVQSRARLLLQSPDGTTLWSNAKLGVGTVVEVNDFAGDGAAEALVTLGARGFALVDVANGAARWEWLVPPGASVVSYKVLRNAKGSFLIVFPQNTIEGFCLEIGRSRQQPEVVWKRSYPHAYWQGFGPSIVLADLDNDGQQEIVLAGKPGYAAAIDAETGAIKFDLHYDIKGGDHAGRPYGLLQAVDMDGDGFRDLAMISCQVEEYAAVLHNEGGKGFRLVWSQFIEHDLPDDFREVRPNVTSFADLDGDGRKELVLGLFNCTGDNRWHTLVLAPMKGLESPLADLPGRYFWGCYDLNGDRRPEIITSSESARKFTETTTLQAVDGKTFRDVATLEKASLFLAGSRLPADTAFLALRQTPIYLSSPREAAGLLLRSAGSQRSNSVWRIENGRSVLSPLRATPTALAVAISSGSNTIEQPDGVLQTKPEERGPSASAPLVSLANGTRELVLALSNGTTIGGEPDFARPGKFKSSWTVPGGMPAIWIGPRGERVVCTYGDGTIYIAEPTAHGAARAPTVFRPPNPLYVHPLTRSGATLLPFGTAHLSLFVGLQTGVHTMASALYDANGTRLWLDPKEGPYPRSAALAALPSGKPALIVDNHGKHLFYDLDGKSRLIAHGWHTTVPNRSDGAKYALPIVGPFGPGGETRVVMSPGLDALEVLSPTGERLARRPFESAYQFDWCGSAVGKIRPTGEWDLAMVTQEGVLHCVDLRTGQTRWTFDLGCKATSPINVLSVDIDGDGRDNFVLGLPNGDLLALDEKYGAGVLLWRLSLDAGIREAIAADVDGDGFVEILVETEDGRVRIFKGSA